MHFPPFTKKVKASKIQWKMHRKSAPGRCNFSYIDLLEKGRNVSVYFIFQLKKKERGWWRRNVTWQVCSLDKMVIFENLFPDGSDHEFLFFNQVRSERNSKVHLAHFAYLKWIFTPLSLNNLLWWSCWIMSGHMKSVIRYASSEQRFVYLTTLHIVFGTIYLSSLSAILVLELQRILAVFHVLDPYPFV